MKTFDLSKEYTFTDDLQKNLKLLKKLFGSKFYIKTSKYKIPVILEYKSLKYKKKYYYQLSYNIGRRETELYPFQIDFITQFNVGNDAYIANINKTDKISGSNMINLVLEILKKLNTNIATLFDGTLVDCTEEIKMDLSFLKLIEKKKSFYEKFGFKYDIYSSYTKGFFNTNKDLYKKLHSDISKFRKIKISYYKKLYTEVINMISTIFIKQDYQNVDIKVAQIDMWDNDYFYKPKDENRSYLIELISSLENVLRIFNNSKNTLLYKLMIELFNDKKKCIDYGIIMKNIINNRLYLIKYKNKKITFDNLEIFNNIEYIRYNNRLLYKF